MIITPSPEFTKQVIAEIERRQFKERTGVHSSDLNYCLNKQAMRKLHPTPNTEAETLLFSIGWATQAWLTGKFEDIPEKEVDGIIVTLDNQTEYQGVLVPWELKSTYTSSNNPIIENAAWIRQIEAQCYVTGATTAFLTRFELLGDWGSVYPKGQDKNEREAYRAMHGKPTLHAYRLEFTEDELRRRWGWFTGRRDIYRAILKTGELLPRVAALPPGGSYECRKCPWATTCGGPNPPSTDSDSPTEAS